MDVFGGSNNDNYNAFNYNDQGEYQAKASDLYGRARTAFIQKVYSILTVQLTITVLMTALSMTSTSFFVFQLENTWLFYLSVVLCLVIQIYVFCCGGARTFPNNMITLGIFTFCEAYIVSFICTITGQQSGNSIVLLAALYTLIMVAACTAYACFTDKDFTTSVGIVIVLSVILMVLFIMTLFTDSLLINNLYCAVGVFLFGIYLIIDTQMIIGGKTIELAMDEYALAALLLYIDIIQIFLYILRLLNINNSNN